MTEQRPSGSGLSTWDLAKPLSCPNCHIKSPYSYTQGCNYLSHVAENMFLLTDISLCRGKNLRSSLMVCPLHGNWFTTQAAPSGHGTCCSSSATAIGSFWISSQCWSKSKSWRRLKVCEKRAGGFGKARVQYVRFCCCFIVAAPCLINGVSVLLGRQWGSRHVWFVSSPLVENVYGLCLARLWSESTSVRTAKGECLCFKKEGFSLWKPSRPDRMWLWATWSNERCHCPWQRIRSRWSLTGSFQPGLFPDSMILFLKTVIES